MLPLFLSSFLTFFFLIGTITLSVHTNSHTDTDSRALRHSQSLAVRRTHSLTLSRRHLTLPELAACSNELVCVRERKQFNGTDIQRPLNDTDFADASVFSGVKDENKRGTKEEQPVQLSCSSVHDLCHVSIRHKLVSETR